MDLPLFAFGGVVCVVLLRFPLATVVGVGVFPFPFPFGGVVWVVLFPVPFP